VSLAGRLVAALGVAGVMALLWSYPLGPWALGVAVLAYAGVLWRWPALWLMLLPAIVPSVQLAPWTGWMMFGEADLFMLATLGVLAVRRPPGLRDVRLSRGEGIALAGFLASAAVSLLLGLQVNEPVGGTSDLYMSAWNGVRLVKPLVSALVLLPFAARREREHGDALELFACGMVLGLGVVSLLAIGERVAFVGWSDFASEYRIAGPFASMHVGGGHIGAYLALALPFTVVLLLRGRRAWALPAFLVSIVLGVAALGLTFARTAYGAGLVAAGATAIAMLAGRSRRSVPALGALVLALAVCGALIGSALSGEFMTERLRQLAPDLATRTANWRQGLGLLGDGAVDRLFGMGIGTYLRLADRIGAASDFRLGADDGVPVLTLRGPVPLYVGQKVAARPGESLTLNLRARSAGGGGVGVALCAKYLLYSTDCDGTRLATAPDGRWSTVSAPLTVPADAGRLIDLSVFADPGATVQVADLHLTAPGGAELLRNGGFADGMRRWFFTSDNHVGWRILNQYLMTLLESGVLGLLALLMLFAMAAASAARALRRGRLVAAAPLGALAGLAVSFAFDAVLEAPALAWTIAMTAGMAMIAGQTRTRQTAGIGRALIRRR